jgi:hypothetical protein
MLDTSSRPVCVVLNAWPPNILPTGVGALGSKVLSIALGHLEKALRNGKVGPWTDADAMFEGSARG